MSDGIFLFLSRGYGSNRDYFDFSLLSNWVERFFRLFVCFYFPPVLHTGQLTRRRRIWIIRCRILEVSDNLKLSHTQNMLPRLMNFLKKNFLIYIKSYEITKPLPANCYARKGFSFCKMFAIQAVCIGMRCGCASQIWTHNTRTLML